MQPTIDPMVLVFDFDGTLAEHRLNYDHEIEFVNSIMPYLGNAEWSEVHNKLKVASSDYAFAYSLSAGDKRERIYAEMLRINMHLVTAGMRRQPENLKQHLQELKGNHRLFMLSGRDPGSLHVALDDMGIAELFEEVLFSDGQFPCKPEPVQLWDLFSRRNISCKNAIYIGDSQNDYHLSQNADCLFIHAAWLRDYPPTVNEPTCDNLADLKSVINRISLSETGASA